ncbi:MerR family transcriptional regulator [Bacillus coahuilensis m2-6]|uniref:MerR family transcriptional regulator n=1 Tax=Bacillus coahuilensis TaxID=408580 RepID=UPI0007500880|nr:MerR family transcriptional regulator [Bacillus coahuilensis]KUP07801.1 MerR family transcriptional regulator [Bacillus coahuilensis m2-6]
MRKSEGKYNIKAMAQMLGIQPGTLRAWERRYQMVEPVRNDSGHRLYTEEQLEKLKWLVEKVNQGFTISQAVSLLDNQKFVDSSILEEAPRNKPQEISNELMNALLSFDETKAHELINQAFALYTMDKVLIDVLGSILVQIGNKWENGEITTAHEHFATSILRARISTIMHSFPQNSFLPKVVAVCGPNEWHELGLLIFTLFLRKKGFDVIYLGSSIKEGDIEVVLDTVKPKLLFLSVTISENVELALQLTEDLSNKYSTLTIGLGGFAIETMTRAHKEKYQSHIVGSNREQWESWLIKN